VRQTIGFLGLAALVELHPTTAPRKQDMQSTA